MHLDLLSITLLPGRMLALAAVLQRARNGKCNVMSFRFADEIRYQTCSLWDQTFNLLRLLLMHTTRRVRWNLEQSPFGGNPHILKQRGKGNIKQLVTLFPWTVKQICSPHFSETLTK